MPGHQDILGGTCRAFVAKRTGYSEFHVETGLCVPRLGVTSPSAAAPYPNPGVAIGQGWQVFGNNAAASGWAFLQFTRSNIQIGSV